MAFSFVWDGKKKAGCMMLMAEQVLEANSLPLEVNTQLVGLVGLTQTLELSKGQLVNTHPDCKYAYQTLNAHAAMWKKSLKQQQETS